MQESDKINSTFKFNDMPIHNEIFDTYRLKREEIEKAIACLLLAVSVGPPST